MRKCIRCGCEMKENCAVKIEGAGYGIVLSSDENKLFGGRIIEHAACGSLDVRLRKQFSFAEDKMDMIIGFAFVVVEG